MNKYLETGKGSLLNIVVRDTELYTKLKERGLELRSDSRLCENYINKGDYNIDFVINTMEEMKWFIKNSSYDIIRDEIIEEDLKYRGRYDNEEVNECAKSRALNDWIKDECPDPIPPKSLYKQISEKINILSDINFDFDLVNDLLDEKKREYFLNNYKETSKIYIKKLNLTEFLDKKLDKCLKNYLDGKLKNIVTKSYKKDLENSIYIINAKKGKYNYVLNERIINIYDEIKDIKYCNNNECIEFGLDLCDSNFCKNHCKEQKCVKHGIGFCIYREYLI